MNFKRFNGSTWETVQHKIYGSGTEQLASFPAMIHASGEAMTDYTIYGNTEQSGTPTPEAPVDVVGCGARTGNVFDISTWRGVTAIRGNTEEVENGFRITALSDDAFTMTYGNSVPQCSYKVSPGETYTLSWEVDNPSVYGLVYLFHGDTVGNAVLGSVASSLQKVTFIVPTDSNFISFRLGVSYSGSSITYTDIMLNRGSTALPYEPYGYKLPITVNGTEHPIYLGQVETTRRTKKHEFTGQENISLYGASATRVGFYFNRGDSILNGRTMGICSHFKPQLSPSGSTIDGITFGANDNNFYFTFSANSVSTYNLTDTASIKAWLAAQYAAGTPVTIWYVLAKPETGIVNEPLHKIGDYADTITMAQAGVTIQTSDGDNIISFGTTVQPSGMSATFKGWHPVQGVKQYDGSEWR